MPSQVTETDFRDGLGEHNFGLVSYFHTAFDHHVFQGSPTKKAKLTNGDSVASAMEKVDAAMAPSPFKDELRATAQALACQPGKGLLACDEPPHVLPGRMQMCWPGKDIAECDEEWRIGCVMYLSLNPGPSKFDSHGC